MEEQLISFETAKLAKEKGFNIPTKKAWIKATNKDSQFFGENKCREVNSSNLFDNEYYAPTQSLLQKWLRDEHEILIRPDHNHFPSMKERDWYCSVKFKYDKWKRACKGKNSYEEALEHGLQKALKFI